MSGWRLFWIGLGTTALSLWYARRRLPLPPNSSWWQRSGRSYGEWKGSWAPITVPLGIVMAVVGLVVGLAGGH
ncbi:MAG TPA: hypothetical protein VEN99_03010 [Acidimicrobiia bacterium]|nr:hypothetical protein [Acidimicrobiia bacterium]